MVVIGSLVGRRMPGLLSRLSIPYLMACAAAKVKQEPRQQIALQRTRVVCLPAKRLLQALHIRLHQAQPRAVGQAQPLRPRRCLREHAAAEIDACQRGQGRWLIVGQV